MESTKAYTATEVRAREETQAIWRSPEDLMWIPDITTRNCEAKVDLETQRYHRCHRSGVIAEESC